MADELTLQTPQSLTWIGLRAAMVRRDAVARAPSRVLAPRLRENASNSLPGGDGTLTPRNPHRCPRHGHGVRMPRYRRGSLTRQNSVAATTRDTSTAWVISDRSRVLGPALRYPAVGHAPAPVARASTMHLMGTPARPRRPADSPGTKPAGMASRPPLASSPSRKSCRMPRRV